MSILRLLCVVGLCVASATLALAQSATSAEPLLTGVQAIAATGIPGPLCVYGEKAFTVATGKLGGQPAPVVAATSFGKGRIVAFGHTGYFSKDAAGKLDTGKLLVNAARWASGKKNATNEKVRVGVVGSGELAAFLKGEGFQVGELAERDLPRAAGQLDVVVLPSHGLSEAGVAEARKLVSSGKGLLTCGLAWGWHQGNPNKTISTDHPGNKLLLGTGLAIADGYLDTTLAGGYKVGAVSPLTNATAALAALVEQKEGRRKLTKAETQQATSAVGLAVRFVNPDQNPVLKAVLAYGERVKDAGLVSAAKPIKLEHGLERALLTARLVLAERLPAEKAQADPNAAAFPGAVDLKAARVKRTMTLKTDLPGWQSTGLYAAPGEAIEVSLNAVAAGAKLGVRIGCHTDENWHHDSWTRCPSISRRWPLTQVRQKFANPFGGPIYIEAPEKCAVAEVEVTFSNAVEAPYFVLGKTSVAEWKKLRLKPAPWAELQADQTIISVPSRVIRELDDPEPVLRHWNKVMAACAELCPRPLRQFRPERYVTDEQISAGYMHSGYPLMTGLDAAEPLVNVKILENGERNTWGLYHEMGHNHQHGEWTFDGTGEVTVNLFTLYVFDKVCGKPRQGHDALKFGAARQKLLRDYLATGPDFGKWKGDPFLALHMYMQLEEEFGWETFRKVFAEYLTLPRGDRPKNDDQKRDQWLVRFSKACGKNLGPFFDAWGMPVSDAAKASVKDLPAWMPKEWPGR